MPDVENCNHHSKQEHHRATKGAAYNERRKVITTLAGEGRVVGDGKAREVRADALGDVISGELRRAPVCESEEHKTTDVDGNEAHEKHGIHRR